MNNLKKYAGLLNEEAPENHFLAYITPGERDMLVEAGGVKTPTESGIFAYPPGYGGSGYQGGNNASDNATGGQGGSSGTGTDGQGSTGGGRNGGSSNYNNNPNNYGGDQEDDVATMETNMGVTTNNNPTGYSGDSGVDAFESSINDSYFGTPDYQGTIFTGGTFGTDKTQGSRTLSYGDDAATEDLGRPDITYFQPTGTLRGDYKSKYELNQIKYIQDSKLKTIKNKLNKAGFDIDKDANFQTTIDFVNNLSSDELPDSYKDLKDNNGDPLYSPETLAEWEESGYVPTSGQMNLPGLGGMLLNKADKPLTKDELLASLNEATEVGKSGGGAMNWQERQKTFQPNRYAAENGLLYNAKTKTFTPKGGGNEQDAFIRSNSAYQVGQTTPQESMVANYFLNMGNNQGMSSAYLTTYNDAKNKIAQTLNLTPNTQQFGFGNTFNNNYARSMTTANPFFEELTDQGLI